MQLAVGIDPGASGGIAVIREDGLLVAAAMPKTEKDIAVHLEGIGEAGEAHAFIEHVHSMPRQGVSSTFKFGQNYGFLRGCLISLEIPFEPVSPGVWQRMFSLPSLKAAGSSVAKKNAHKARAQEMYPKLKVTHATADAILLAEYCRRTLASRVSGSSA